ncbi:MAG TPA: hypothetical protein VFF60_05260 [Candidatus Binatus sp.]|nr:hypothetical protein [Candidatus Binatus sp.]
MLTTHTQANGAQTIDDVKNPFVRLPHSNANTVFQGWGPRI